MKLFYILMALSFLICASDIPYNEGVADAEDGESDDSEPWETEPAGVGESDDYSVLGNPPTTPPADVEPLHTSTAEPDSPDNVSMISSSSGSEWHPVAANAQAEQAENAEAILSDDAENSDDSGIVQLTSDITMPRSRFLRAMLGPDWRRLSPEGADIPPAGPPPATAVPPPAGPPPATAVPPPAGPPPATAEAGNAPHDLPEGAAEEQNGLNGFFDEPHDLPEGAAEEQNTDWFFDELDDKEHRRRYTTAEADNAPHELPDEMNSEEELIEFLYECHERRLETREHRRRGVPPDAQPVKKQRIQ